jgi:hypothetical protein
MAEVLKSFEFKANGGGRGKHPWSTYVDGQIRKLYKADIFDASCKTFVAVFYRQAKKVGKRVRYSLNKADGYIVIQAYVPDANGEAETPPEEPAKKGRGRKAK